QVIDKLSAAAQRIAEEERDESILHKRPHASRLAPIRDISADIRRESTPSVEADVSRPSLMYRPLPAPADRAIDDNTPMPGHFPSSNEAARIEEEDIRRAMAEETTAERSGAHFKSSASVPKRRRTRNQRSGAKRISTRLRIIFIILTILAVLALIVDGILLS